MRLRDTVVLVVGASGGIGSAVAAAANARGAQVIVHGHRPSDRLERVASEAGAKWVAADLARPGGAQQLAQAAREVRGRIDVVIHCAGVGHLGTLDAMPPDAIDQLVAVNLTSAMQLSRAVVGDMQRRRSGQLVFVASIAGWVGVAQEAVYSATKAGVITFADSLRSELVGSGVGVSVVSPAAVRTPFFERRGAAYDRRFPRELPPERVAQAVIHAVEHDVPHRMIPRWLAVAPAVRTALPGPFRALNQRFGQAPTR